VGGYKSAVTSAINGLRGQKGSPVWQRNYHEHVIRDEASYLKIAEYVQTNPLRWEDDIYHA
jgi:REP element-mobilizing transposase RayT